MIEKKRKSLNETLLTPKYQREDTARERVIEVFIGIDLSMGGEYLISQPFAKTDKPQSTRRDYSKCHLSHIKLL